MATSWRAVVVVLVVALSVPIQSEDCVETTVTSQRVVESDNFLPDSDCGYKIALSPGTAVHVTVTDHSFEETHGTVTDCKYDFLQFFDGEDDSATELLQLCGHKRESDDDIVVIANSRHMYIKLTTDSSNNTGWFNFTVQERDKGCGGTVDEPSGWINSTDWDGRPGYSNFQRCEWQVSVPQDYIVQLTFSQVELEKCPHDFLEISDDGERAPDAPTTRTVCGDNPVNDFVSTGRDVNVYFRADSTVTKGGFAIWYEAVWNGSISTTTEPSTTTESLLTTNFTTGPVNGSTDAPTVDPSGLTMGSTVPATDLFTLLFMVAVFCCFY